MLPIVGSAYARSQEYSSDLHGIKCCKKPKDAVFAMAVLALGAEQWNKLNIKAYASQSEDTGSFWMSFHELTATYPWLSKRMQHLLGKSANVEPSFSKRSALAWLLALFVPRIGSGGGSLVSLMIVVAIAGILSSIALPAYHSYQQRAEMASAQTTMSEPSEQYAAINEPDMQQQPSPNRVVKKTAPSVENTIDVTAQVEILNAQKAMIIAS
ncbi:M48 family metalloprotease [Leucothrix arctica]|uniref:Peptidase M48 domain-containing protein n=1 Tax=Leucothrix arctica TaxID=1481894 RepID=A0A317CIN6_9GAMM|nr:M48 family metalloprotease [Leucothrix arctica]PWQ98428.1 hypothetical protein DKT75_04705 [Leucothrix arctica]